MLACVPGHEDDTAVERIRVQPVPRVDSGRLGGGSDGAMQLPGRTSVVPGGHCWPGAMRVPPRMPSAAITAPSAAEMMTTTAVRGIRIRTL